MDTQCVTRIQNKKFRLFLEPSDVPDSLPNVITVFSLSHIMVIRLNCRNIKGEKKVPFLFLPLSTSPQDLPPPPQLDFSRLVWASAVWKPDGNFLEAACSTLTASL